MWYLELPWMENVCQLPLLVKTTLGYYSLLRLLTQACPIVRKHLPSKRHIHFTLWSGSTCATTNNFIFLDSKWGGGKKDGRMSYVSYRSLWIVNFQWCALLSCLYRVEWVAQLRYCCFCWLLCETHLMRYVLFTLYTLPSQLDYTI